VDGAHLMVGFLAETRGYYGSPTPDAYLMKALSGGVG
jgi:hypothetical protein